MRGPRTKVKGSKFSLGPSDQILSANLTTERKPDEGAAEAADPVQVRPPLRVEPPDIAGPLVTIEGTFLRSNHVHRVEAKLLMELRFVFANGEHLPRDSPFQTKLPGPRDRLVPAPTAREVEENQFLFPRAPFRQILIPDLVDIVVSWGVGTGGIHCLLPVTVANDRNRQNVEAATRWRDDRGADGDWEPGPDSIENTSHRSIIERCLEASPIYPLTPGHLHKLRALTVGHGYNLFSGHNYTLSLKAHFKLRPQVGARSGLMK